MDHESASPTDASIKRLPRTVWMLGWVSLCMDASSELIHAVLPVYMTTVLGMPVTEVGFVEGLAESAASVMKAASGMLSDHLGRRKWLAVLGYGLSASTKPLFALATGALTLGSARFLDRIGKGLRGAPRDALLADTTPPGLRNAAYGLRQSMDTVGACLGPLMAMLLLFLHWPLRGLMWFALPPALLAVLLLVLGVREAAPRADAAEESASRREGTLERLRQLPPAYWRVIGIAIPFTLARLSEAFLVLRGAQLGLGLSLIPVITLLFSLVFSASAYPAGLLAQRYGRRKLLMAGLAVLLGSLLLLVQPGLSALWVGVALYGLHLGLTQGVFAAAVAASAPVAARGSAFGLFYLVTGVLQLTAGIGAGWIWQTWGASWVFGAAATLAATTLLLSAVATRGDSTTTEAQS